MHHLLSDDGRCGRVSFDRSKNLCLQDAGYLEGHSRTSWQSLIL